MLSYIIRIAEEYRSQHGVNPNLIYLNNIHLNILKLELGNPEDIHLVMSDLGIEINLDQSKTHPSVGNNHIKAQLTQIA